MLRTLRSDPQTSEEEHFKLVLVQTEMERVKFLIRSYVRTRLAKVCLHPQIVPHYPLHLHSHSLPETSLKPSTDRGFEQIEKFSYWITINPSIHLLLSGAELSHARR